MYCIPSVSRGESNFHEISRKSLRISRRFASRGMSNRGNATDGGKSTSWRRIKSIFSSQHRSTVISICVDFWQRKQTSVFFTFACFICPPSRPPSLGSFNFHVQGCVRCYLQNISFTFLAAYRRVPRFTTEDTITRLGVIIFSEKNNNKNKKDTKCFDEKLETRLNFTNIFLKLWVRQYLPVIRAWINGQ